LSGRQLNFSIRGEQYEKAFDGIASRFLSVVRVPRPDDYGIDDYCHILRPLDGISSTVGGTFGVQIRGPGCNLQFGGTNEKGNAWKSYEIEWLRSLAVPLYLPRVNVDCTRVDFYSLWPVWLVLGGSPAPFRIICEFDDPSNNPFTLPEATEDAEGICRKFRFLRQNPKIGSRKFNDLQTPKLPKKQLYDRTPDGVHVLSHGSYCL